MSSRALLIAAAAFGLGAGSASAGGGCVGECYRKVVHPPVYGSVAEHVVLRPALTTVSVAPAAYATVAETVMVSPARKEWRMTVDQWGRQVGCWVDVPAAYATQHRSVLVRQAQVVHQTIPAIQAVRHRPVLVSPAHASWQRMGGYGTSYVGFAGYGSYEGGYGSPAGGLLGASLGVAASTIGAVGAGVGLGVQYGLGGAAGAYGGY